MSNTIEIARQILAQNERLLTLIEGGATPAVKAATPKASKATTKAKAKATTKAAPKGDATVRHLVRKNRPAFVKAHPWAAGLSTAQIAEAVVTGAQTCEPGWAIGERREALVTGKAPAKAEAKPKAKAKSSKAGKGKTRQVAVVEADAPAKERAADGPRDALGRITPRSTWALREALAMTAQFDRHQIDAIVAAQV